MYTRVATICIEDSIVSKSSISYRFTTELGLTATTKAMEKFLKELNVFVKDEDLDKIESNDETQFFYENHGLPDSREEIE